jgi:bacterioferritin
LLAATRRERPGKQARLPQRWSGDRPAAFDGTTPNFDLGETAMNNGLIKKLNEILAHEWTGVAQYAQQAFMVRGLWREAYAGFFNHGAEESFGHAKKIGEKIVALGGIPTIERNKVKQSDDLREMLEHALEFERTAVRHYAEALELAADDRPLVVLLEDLILEEQDGVDEIEKLLREEGTAAAAAPKKAAKGKVG